MSQSIESSEKDNDIQAAQFHRSHECTARDMMPSTLVSDHVLTKASPCSPVLISLKPMLEKDNEFQLTKEFRLPDHPGLGWENQNRQYNQNQYRHYDMNNVYEYRQGGEASSCPPYPEFPTPVNHRVPIPMEPRGFMYIGEEDKGAKRNIMASAITNSSKENQESLRETQRDDAAPSPILEYVTEETFKKIYEDFKGEDGSLLALTAYGAIPLPKEMLQTIPDKFHTKPIIQEREVFVLKKENVTRLSHQEYTQYDHNFKDVSVSIVVEKIKAVDQVKVIEVPYFKYKPVIEEKIVEVPCGIKYVEVPIEIPCSIPPRILPIPKTHTVERIIEASKPVVQEKIIEVPEIVRKKVPKIVIKEIPYVVPKYVEKIIEVPYQLCDHIPKPQGVQQSSIPSPIPLPIYPPDSLLANLNKPYGSATDLPLVHYSQMQPEFYMENDTMIVNPQGVDGSSGNRTQTFYLDDNIKHVKLPYEAEIDISIEEKNLTVGKPLAQSAMDHMTMGDPMKRTSSSKNKLDYALDGFLMHDNMSAADATVQGDIRHQRS